MTQTIGLEQKLTGSVTPITPELRELPEATELIQIADLINSAHSELVTLTDRYPAQSNWDTDATWTHQWLAENSDKIQSRLEAKLAGEEFSLGEVEAQIAALEEAISTTRLLAYAPAQRRERMTEPIQLVPEQIALLRAQFEFLRTVYRATHDDRCEINELSPKAEWYEVRGAAEREGIDPSRVDVSQEHQDGIHIAYWDYVNKPISVTHPSNPLFKDWVAMTYPDMSESDTASRFVHLYGEWYDSPHYRANVSDAANRARKNMRTLADKLGVSPKQTGDMFGNSPWLKSTLISVSEQIEQSLTQLDGAKDADDRRLLEQDEVITELERQATQAYRLSNLPDALKRAKMADIDSKLQDVVAALLLERVHAVDLGEDTTAIDVKLDRFSRTGAFLPYIVEPIGTEPNRVEVAQAYIESLQGALTSKHLARIAATALAA